MGEVRELVKLTNYDDLVLVKRGFLNAEKIHSLTIDALVDTGAVLSVVPLSIAQQLGLNYPREELVEYANGEREKVPLTDVVEIYSQSTGRIVLMECAVLGNEVILGQLFLERADLIVDCPRRKITYNPEHQGQAVVKIK